MILSKILPMILSKILPRILSKNLARILSRILPRDRIPTREKKITALLSRLRELNSLHCMILNSFQEA
jgi:hypothetical protein